MVVYRGAVKGHETAHGRAGDDGILSVRQSPVVGIDIGLQGIDQPVHIDISPALDSSVFRVFVGQRRILDKAAVAFVIAFHRNDDQFLLLLGQIFIHTPGLTVGSIFINAPVFYHTLDARVFVLKLTPGIQPGIFDYLAENYRAVIIESFGVGGIPVYDSEAFADKIAMLTEKGVKVIIKTQVAHEGSDMEIYRVGFTIKQRFNLLEAYDMTTEAAFAKTMWALGNSCDDAGFRALFTASVGADKVS